MTEFIKQAIDKIDKEAEQSNNKSVMIIASYILDNYLNSDENAKKILDEKKSLSDCLKVIKEKARKQATGSMAMVEDVEVFNWAVEYFGLKAEKKNGVIDILDFM